MSDIGKAFFSYLAGMPGVRDPRDRGLFGMPTRPLIEEPEPEMTERDRATAAEKGRRFFDFLRAVDLEATKISAEHPEADAIWVLKQAMARVNQQRRGIK